MSNLSEAIAQCEINLARSPNDIASLNQLAMLEASAGQHTQAFSHICAALRLAPNHPLLRYNLGQVHGSAGRFEDEIKAYQQAIDLKPDFLEAYVNMGVALRDMQRFDEAFEAFKQALRINPDHPGARTNRAQTNLMLGNFEHGWRDYEWRWKDGHQSHDIKGVLWNGKTSLKGKRLLIHAEQGLGDTLQFVRYLDLLKSLGCIVFLRLQPPLAGLLSGYAGADMVIDTQSPVPEFDFHIPLLSLPHALYSRHPGIPCVHHYLTAAPEKVTYWSQWLAHKINERTGTKAPAHTKKQLKIGLCWSGSTHHLNDQNRSMTLAQWRTLFSQGCVFVSLQKEIRDADLDTLDSHTDIVNAGLELNTFEDTAGLMCNLDLVITVDTSVAHLSAALGIPTWILLPEPADWRWLRNRTDSPWYPSVRLFRQTVRADWSNVMDEVRQELAALCQTSNE
ncbi:MAG: tetratricopeptide repeat-containing glycosyltransferase family protein [Gallionella sp.]|nr:tetratricopeptide repeat-containing glycosyltransferase family protein [Gallionella sp.]